jgi:Resolvase, N terminal domain
MLLGYARVSQGSQDHALQLDALRAAGCDKVFVETGSGTRTDRPELPRHSNKPARMTFWWSGVLTGWQGRCGISSTSPMI